MVITKEIAEKNLQEWVNASTATASAKSYKIGSRELERSDATEIIKMINYWQTQVNNFNKPNGQMFRPIIRDL